MIRKIVICRNLNDPNLPEYFIYVNDDIPKKILLKVLSRAGYEPMKIIYKLVWFEKRYFAKHSSLKNGNNEPFPQVNDDQLKLMFDIRIKE